MVQDPRKIRQADTDNIDLSCFILGHGSTTPQEEIDSVQLHGASIIEIVLLQDQSLTDSVLLQFERTSAVWPKEPGPSTPLYVLLVHYKCCGIGKLGQEVSFGRIDGYLQGEIVDHLDSRDLSGIPLELVKDPLNVPQVGLGYWRPQYRVGRPLQRVFEITRGNLFAVMESDVIFQEEGVNTTTATDIPALSNVGHDLQVPINGDQATEQLHHVDSRVHVGRQVRVPG